MLGEELGNIIEKIHAHHTIPPMAFAPKDKCM
jgi:hypothetical protein